jgi:glycosyltransferase involved in cell wall biosynthesis
LRLALGVATAVVSTSRYTVGVYRRWRNRDYPVIYVGSPAFKPPPPGEPRKPDALTQILVVGTIQPRKGQDAALAALKRMPPAQLKRFSLEFIGRVEQADYHRRLLQSTRIATPAGPRQLPVKWTGEATPPKVFEAMCRSDIILVPSQEDVTPVVVLEAMSFGRCVVAHDIGGLGEMMQDRITGRLYRPNDLDHLVEILTELDEHPEQRTQLGQAAQLFVRENRSVQKWAEQYSTLIERAFQRRIAAKAPATRQQPLVSR